MISKEEVRKHYIFTTKHELDEDNKMLKQYIEQLEKDKEELEGRFNEFVKVEQTADSINFALPINVAKEFDKVITNINIVNENNRLRAREQKLIEKLKKKIRYFEENDEFIASNNDNYSDGTVIAKFIKEFKEILEILKGEKNE